MSEDSPEEMMEGIRTLHSELVESRPSPTLEELLAARDPASPPIKIFGKPEVKVFEQLERCLQEGRYGVICADAHVGYSMPIGGVIAYPDHVSPSGVGYDIGCGNKAVRTDINVPLSYDEVAALMDEIRRRISFGLGRANAEPVDDPVLEEISRANFVPQRKLLNKAAEQLGTVGSGNHYVDLLRDTEGYVWVGVHFGSRGFGHRTATGFLALSQGKSFESNASEGEMHSPPILFDTRTPLGQDYIAAMQLAGRYAYAGRNWVVDRVLKILGAEATFEVHNHHNFAWRERHFGKDFWVVRKGATPAFPGQQGFVGGSMGDISVILEGIDSQESKSALYSTVHGAGRVMSRTKAAGKRFRGRKGNVRKVFSPGLINWDEVNKELKARGIVIRGGDADEAPAVYRQLADVVALHSGTVRVLRTLQPIGVAMAGYDVRDPYKD